MHTYIFIYIHAYIKNNVPYVFFMYLYVCLCPYEIIYIWNIRVIDSPRDALCTLIYTSLREESIIEKTYLSGLKAMDKRADGRISTTIVP